MIATFDTEGTTVTNPLGTFGVCYYWDFCILNGDYNDVYPETVESLTYHETGRDCASLYRKLQDLLAYWDETGDTVKIAVHNLTYDYGYLRHFFVNASDLGFSVDVCARNSTHLITISLKRGKDTALVFYDSLALFRTSLRSLGEALGYRKLDLDYYRAIAPDTILDANALAYNTRDTELLMVALCRNFLSLPYVGEDKAGRTVVTKTGMVKAFDRESAFIGQAPMGRRTAYEKDRYEVTAHQFQDPEEMERWNSYSNTRASEVKGCYAGGVNLANTNITGLIIEDVEAFDLTSAYPGIMLGMRIPTNPLHLDTPSIMDFLLDPCAPDPASVATMMGGFWIGTIRFEGFRMRDDWRAQVGDSSMTVAMAKQNQGSEGVVYCNGYLDHAQVIVLTMATPVFHEICCEYEWDSASFTDLTVYQGKERPTVYQNLQVLYHYAEKSTAKALASNPDPRGAKAAYARGYITYDEMEMISHGSPSKEWRSRLKMSHKENLNALYGIKVTNPLRDSFGINDFGYLENLHDGSWDTYKSMKRDQKMWREAGVLTSLFNRYKIVYACRLIVDAGGEVLYTDTDSIKVVGLDKESVDHIMAPMHESIERSIRDMVDYTSKAVPDSMPDLDPGFYKLGKFDWEGHIDRFYTPGHKKYAMDQGKGWEAKCAGYSVKVVQSFMDAVSAEGHDDIAPIMALGYDVRYDSSTDIATALASIDRTWISVDFEALDQSDGESMHVYKGDTCPGYAVLKVGKIMNNTAQNELNTQRFNAACKNNPQVGVLSRIDVSMMGGDFIWGKRGSVPMQFKNWEDNRGECII